MRRSGLVALFRARPQQSALVLVGGQGGQQTPERGGPGPLPHPRRPAIPTPPAGGTPTTPETSVPDEYLLRLEASGEVTPAPNTTEPEPDRETEEEQ